MKTFGITLAEGTDITNMTMDSGDVFPAEPSLGELFYLTGPNQGLYVFDGTNWIFDVLEDDKRLNIENTIQVQKDPGPGQFGTVKEALESITDAGPTRRYVVKVAGGSYYEDNPVQLKRYVSVVGDSAVTVHINALDPQQDLFLGQNDASIERLTLTGAYGEGASAIRFSDAVENNITRSFFVDNVRFGRNHHHIMVSSSGNYTALYLSNSLFGGSQPYDEGFHVEAKNGATTRLIIRSCGTRGSLAPFATHFGYVTGAGAEAIIVGSLFRTSATGQQGIGFRIRDGATLRTVGTTLRGFETAVWVENAGASPMLNAYNLGLESNAVDIKIDHPTARGVFQGIAAASKVFSASADVSIMYLDPSVQGVNIVGRMNLGAEQSLLTDVTDLIIETAPLGILKGGQLSPAGGNSVLVAPGSGYLRRDGHVTRVEWKATVLNLPPMQPVYIFVNKQGEVTFGPGIPNSEEQIALGRANPGAAQLNGLGGLGIHIRNYGNMVEDYLRTAVGPVFVSGSIVTENATIPRAIDVTAGVFYFGTAVARPTARTAPPLVDIHRSGGMPTMTVVQQVPNGTIDNGTGLVSMQPGYFTKHGLYTTPEGQFESLYLSHGQVEYETLEEAIAAPLPLPRLSPDATPQIAAIITQQGNDNIVQILDIRPMIMRGGRGSSGGASDHGDLLGLADDDHPQYMLASGTRPFTGDTDFGGNDIENVNLINGLQIQSHGARHTPQGPDPIPTAPAVSLTIESTNTEGIANTLARSDHTHAMTGFQPASPELTALSTITGVGFAAHIHVGGDHHWGVRSIVGTDKRITVTNGDGHYGDPTIDLSPIGTAGTYRAVTTDIFGRVISGTNPTTLAGYGITDAQPLDSDLTALANLTAPGVYVNTGPGTAAIRTITGTAGTITITNGNGVNGDPVINLSSAGVPGTYRSVTTDIYGRVISGNNPTTLAGYGITDAQPLDSDLTALANLTTTGIYVNTGVGAVAARAITAGSSKLSITNGNGVTGNPTIDVVEANLTLNNISGTLATSKGGTGLATIGSGNTHLGVNAAGTALEYKTINGTANQITVAETVGATTVALAPNTAIPGTSGIVVPSGTTAQRINTPGAIRLNTTTSNFESYNGTAWQPLSSPNTLVQYFYGSVAPMTGTSIIPYGTTAPTSTQGTLVWSQTITPLDTRSAIEIQFSGVADISTTSSYVIMTCFRGTVFIGMSILAAGKNGADFTNTLVIALTDAPATTSPVTYSVRIGASAGTWYLGRGQLATFGNAARSHWTIREYS